MNTSVSVREELVELPTYEPHAPDRNPMFLEKRVYQGSSGRVYPLPITDRIAEKPTPRKWKAVFLENEFLQVMMMPELGGRIHRAIDKTNGYDFFYYQPIIKPALIGLIGPFVSGGVEFNWPQHHRPSNFMPSDMHIERHEDGAITVWLSEHDPLARMKGMHGVCLYPKRAYIELKVRVYNRTTDVKSFLWWANAAERVHEQYQSFFPPDVYYVADHAKRATSAYPLCKDRYYGVDYAGRARRGLPANEIPHQFLPPYCRPASSIKSERLQTYRADDLSWYGNITVATSYMCMGSQEDFLGGYDHKVQAGMVGIANHHIAPGKKYWTWGNHELGYAWDRNLTDPDEEGVYRPFIELMSGVYTDNQPDFSFIQPGETKSWSQYWYPIRAIGPAQHANLEAAVSLSLKAGVAKVGVAVSVPQPGALVRLEARGRELALWTLDLSLDKPLVAEVKLAPGLRATDLMLRVNTAGGRELIHYQPRIFKHGEVPPPATEPPRPAEIASADELFVTGLHLEQYRHATRAPDIYWREALRRDPNDARCNLALGRWHLRRGELAAAEQHLRASIARLTRRNLNPPDGEPYYHLGVCLRHQRRDTEAYDAFYKATWNYGWEAAGYHALAEIDCTRSDWATALDHLKRALRVNTENLRARDLKVIVLRNLKRDAEATELLKATLALDPLDWLAHHLNLSELRCDTQVRLDLALDYARAGCFLAALDVLAGARPERASGTAPLVEYYRGWLHTQVGNRAAAKHAYATAARASADYCFPARLEEIAILEAAIVANPSDARAPFYLGNLFYDRRRHHEAITNWKRAVRLDPGNTVAWRNLGIGYFNILHKPAKARAAYERAFRGNPADPRLLYERDQLWKRVGEAPARRLRELEKNLPLVLARDDLSLELCALYNQTGQSDRALAIVGYRKFQPWEGGEGKALDQHVQTHLLLGRASLAKGDTTEACRLFKAALSAPENLSEARHYLANQSDVHFWLGEAYRAAGEMVAARRHWTAAATFRGDFQDMKARTFSEKTYYSALAWQRLGKKTSSRKLLRELAAYAGVLAKTQAKIDYFATSLPTMLLFEDDLQARQTTTALFLKAQARLGLGQSAAARRLLRQVLARDPNHAPAADLLAWAGSGSRPD